MRTYVVGCNIRPNPRHLRNSRISDGAVILFIKAGEEKDIEEIAKRYLAENDLIAMGIRRIGTTTRRRVRDWVECLSAFEECQR